MSEKMSLKSKIDELIEYIVNGTEVDDPRMTGLLEDPEVQDYISKQEVGCVNFGCGEDCTAWHSPLHLAAAFKGKTEIMTELLNYGANVNIFQATGTTKCLLTPLHYAIYLNNWDIVEILMDNGANPDIKGNGCNIEQKTPLELIRKKIQDYVKIAQDLKKKSVETTGNVGGLPLKLDKLETASKFIPSLKTKRDEIDHLSDVQIICKAHSNDETIFKCHKFVLSICSPVFFDMFKDENSEASMSRKIILKGISVHVMKKFLDFLYEDGLENVDLDDVEELLKVGKRYKVDGLKKTCEQELIKILAISNCVFMLHLAKKVGIDQLEAKALDMVIENLAEVRACKDFMLLMQDFPDALYEERD